MGMTGMNVENGEHVEIIARTLHDSAKAAVEQGKTVAATNLGEGNPLTRRFLPWEEISEEAREGRRMQARVILQDARFQIYLNQ